MRRHHPQHGVALRALDDGGLPVFQGMHLGQQLQRNLLGRAGGSAAAELDVFALEPGGDFFHRLGGRNLAAQLLGSASTHTGGHEYFLQIEDAPL